MAHKKITLADVMGDTIDQKAFEKPAPSGKKKAFRTKTGGYIGHLAATYLKIVDSGPNEGRKFMSVLVKLYTEDKKFRGTAFAQLSWMLRTKANGDPDLQFKLFQQVVNVMGAPATADLSDILEAVQGEYMAVWGKEYFNVKVKDLLPEDRDKAGNRGPEHTVFVFIEDGEDEKAEYYMSAGDEGYESKFMIMRFSELEDAEE